MSAPCAVVRELNLGFTVADVFAGLCDAPGAFLLESAQAAGGLGRWSFLGSDPFLRFTVRSGRARLSVPGEPDRELTGEPLAELRALLRQYRCAAHPDIPFVGGAVGYFSYEYGASLERVSSSHVDDLGTADIDLGFHDGVVAFDHATTRAYLIAAPAGKTADAIFERLGGMLARVKTMGPAAAGLIRQETAAPLSAYTKDEYMAAVRRVREYIAAGDVYQVNLTQRFEARWPGQPYELYRRLRRRSPAPFAAYLNLDPLLILSSSPERFLRVRQGTVETRPIKGTRRRGANPAEDARLVAELSASPKDRAELLMIVDLERNDLGRVCVPGSIEARDLFTIETHPTVHHLVANLSGRLAPDRDVLDCLRAALPGGSITGAPKIRAMQIIDELEVTPRGVYTGALGYLGFDGGCDLNIAIRTMIHSRGRVVYHGGGGVVWDSEPEAEYQETLDKCAAMRGALMDPDDS